MLVTLEIRVPEGATLSYRLTNVNKPTPILAPSGTDGKCHRMFFLPSMCRDP